MSSLNESQPFESGLAQMSRNWKSSSDQMTAFKQINSFRRDFTPEDFKKIIAGTSPSNVDPLAWTDSTSAFNSSLTELNRKINCAAESEEANFFMQSEAVMREVAFELERDSRRAYDAMTDRYVEALGALQESGRLESEMAKLDPAVLRIVRAGITRLPQPQIQSRLS